MAGVLVNNGESIALQLIVGKIVTPEPLDLRLFTNNVTPGEVAVAGDLIEAAGNGYGAVALVGANWVVSGSAPTQVAYPQQTFTFTGALGNVYGYYLTRHSSLDLVIAERFADGPYNIQNNGDTIKVTAQMTLD